MAEAASGLSLAFEFAGAVFLFWFIGRLVDNWLGIEPWGQLVGSLVGWGGGFAHVYYATQRRSQAPPRRPATGPQVRSQAHAEPPQQQEAPQQATSYRTEARPGQRTQDGRATGRGE